MANPRGLVAAALGFPAVLLSLAAAGPGVLPGDVGVERSVEALSIPWLDRIAQAANLVGAGWLGYTLLTLLLLVPLLIVRSHRLALILVISSVLRVAVFPLKAFVASPRPTADLVGIVEVQADPGFPSGHAFGATVLFGTLWLAAPVLFPHRVPGLALRVFAVAAIAITAVARVRVGAHWPSDVLGGILWGATALALLTAVFEPRPQPIAPDDNKRADTAGAGTDR